MEQIKLRSQTEVSEQTVTLWQSTNTWKEKFRNFTQKKSRKMESTLSPLICKKNYIFQRLESFRF